MDLSSAPALEELDISEAKSITDDAVAHLARLPKLRRLSLHKTP